MAFTVLYDANVLYGIVLSDLLVRIAARGVVRARWSQEIADEAIRNLTEERPDDEPRFKRRLAMQADGVPDALITGHQDLVEGLKLKAVSDRHVLAAAIRGGAEVIVTFNLRHFPPAELKPFGIEAQHPDEFLLNQLNLDPKGVINDLLTMSAMRKSPVKTPGSLLETIRAAGCSRSADALLAALRSANIDPDAVPNADELTPRAQARRIQIRSSKPAAKASSSKKRN
jgi:hypothetical protein